MGQVVDRKDPPWLQHGRFMTHGRDPSTGDDEPGTSTGTQTFVKRLFADYSPGSFQGMLRVGFTGLDDGDLVLAKATADYVLSRAASGSGDMMRAMLLRAMVYERSGKEGRGNELMNAIIQRRF